jgi:hypothetical protein
MRVPVKLKSHRVRLSEDAQRYIANQMSEGMSVKHAAFNYGISVAYGHRIFNRYLEWKVVWKEERVDADNNSTGEVTRSSSDVKDGSR